MAHLTFYCMKMAFIIYHLQTRMCFVVVRVSTSRHKMFLQFFSTMHGLLANINITAHSLCTSKNPGLQLIPLFHQNVEKKTFLMNAKRGHFAVSTYSILLQNSNNMLPTSFRAVWPTNSFIIINCLF